MAPTSRTGHGLGLGSRRGRAMGRGAAAGERLVPAAPVVLDGGGESPFCYTVFIK